MKPWYRKRKLWTAVIAAIAAGAAHYTGNPEIAESITALGLAVIAGLGLEDFGKARDRE